MKQIKIILFSFLVFSLKVFAQNPVAWAYSLIKKTGSGYDIHLTARVQPGWHVYAQRQPRNAIPLPTRVMFSHNPLVILEGKTKEIGNKEIHTDEIIGSTDWRYANKLDLVQTITLRAKVSTGISGSITYQACTDEKCLAPKTVNFDLKIE